MVNERSLTRKYNFIAFFLYKKDIITSLINELYNIDKNSPVWRISRYRIRELKGKVKV